MDEQIRQQVLKYIKHKKPSGDENLIVLEGKIKEKISTLRVDKANTPFVKFVLINSMEIGDSRPIELYMNCKIYGKEAEKYQNLETKENVVVVGTLAKYAKTYGVFNSIVNVDRIYFKKKEGKHNEENRS